jgi:clorobiocin biosynthesis protein CloN5
MKGADVSQAQERVQAVLTSFIRTQFLDGDAKGELELTTPLLKWGVLDSLKTAQLINFIRDELGAQIPPQDLSARNFKDVISIAAAVVANGGGVKDAVAAEESAAV